MKKKTIKRAVVTCAIILCVAISLIVFYRVVYRYRLRVKVLEQIVERLEADTRIAEVLVTNVEPDHASGKTMTTIKFMEYDASGHALAPRYFTFSGNIIQFQSLVIRFDDRFVRGGDTLKGKSAYLFWKVFMLDGDKTQEYVITPVNTIPNGYKIDSVAIPYEEYFWHEFWQFALDPDAREAAGIKNAQLEAPGTLFVPGSLYTVRIEHDGGIRIDAEPLSPILLGETIIDQKKTGKDRF